MACQTNKPDKLQSAHCTSFHLCGIQNGRGTPLPSEVREVICLAGAGGMVAGLWGPPATHAFSVGVTNISLLWRRRHNHLFLCTMPHIFHTLAYTPTILHTTPYTPY